MEGTYEILSVIGRSGLGTLYRARYQGTGAFTKLVTLKRLDEGVADTDEVACRLRDEARVLGFLEHRAIVRVDNLVRLEGRWTLVLGHVDGVNLDGIIERGPVPTGPALEIIGTVAGALHAAYTTQGPDGSPLRLQHRDVKPGAILIDAYGAPRVTDFGIARACFTGREARTRSFVVGSFEYMAPERLALEEGGPWSDIYSLGQVFYALLTGHSFGRSHPSERHHKVIIDKAMEKILGRPGGIDEGALELLGRMLALEPHERPDARSVERTCHQLTRRLEDETLRGWAEQVVEPMLEERNASTQGGLVGKRLRESDVPSSVNPPPRPVVPDPSFVAARPAVGSPRPTARRELEPLPVHNFTASRDEDDATEIMRRPEAGGPSLLDDEEADSDATEMFTAPLREPLPLSTGLVAAPAPVDALEGLDDDNDEPAVEPETPEDDEEHSDALDDVIDLSVPDSEVPVFRSEAPPVFDLAEAPAIDPVVEPPLEQVFSDEPAVLDLVSPILDEEPSEDLDRPTVAFESEEDELDQGRPTVVQEPGTGIDDDDPGMMGRPTTISWLSDEIGSELPQQEPNEVTAVTPPEISGELHPAFSMPVGALDEHTAIGADLETVRAERSEMAQVRFDMPVAQQDDSTIECDDSMVPIDERPQEPLVRFDMPAGAFDEHTALGEDIEAARSGHEEMAQVRFDMPAGALDQHTALGEDIEQEREREGPAAMPRVQFDAPETAAAPAPQRPLPPALEMPGAAPPPPPQPLSLPGPPAQAEPPPFEPVPAAPPPFEPPPPLPVEPPPPPPFDDGPPTAHVEPPAEPDPVVDEPYALPPAPVAAPPPPPPPPAAESDDLDRDRPTQSSAQPWTPGLDQSSSQGRPQADFWEPPSVQTLGGAPADQPPALTPAPMPFPSASSPAVEVEIVDDPASVDVRDEPEVPLGPAPTPQPAVDVPAPTEGQDATVARGDTSGIVPADAQPPARGGKGKKLLLVLAGLVMLGALFVGLVASLGAVWYFLF